MKPHFKTIKVCPPYKTGCWAQTYNKNGTKYVTLFGFAKGDCVGFITQDGYNFSIDTWVAQDFENVKALFGVNVSGKTNILVIHVDANGMKGPNIIGKDVFAFVLSEKGLTPAGSDKSDSEVEQECKTIGQYCFAHIIRNNWKISLEDVW